jgi:hypothetical protein
MATELRPPARPAAPSKAEAFVERQLAQVHVRLRLRDLGAAALVLGIVVLSYGLGVSLADRLWDLSAGVRLAAWCILVLGIFAYLSMAVHRFCLRRVNPLYLAWQLEKTVPEAKNSVINWLELHDEPLPPIIRGSMTRHAARDLKEADPDQAVSLRPLLWLTAVAVVLLVVQGVWLIASPAHVLSLLKRAYLPFERHLIAARTELTLLKPDAAEISVPPNQPVLIRVKVDGYVPALNQPDSLKLHFRNNPNEEYEPRSLTRDVDGTWTTVILADQVRNGFSYHISGGDAQLPLRGDFKVVVRPIPQIQSFEINYHYRPYLHKKDLQQKFDANKRLAIKELRGTEVTLVLRANRPLKQCQLELKSGNGKNDLTGVRVGDDGQAWQFQFVLERDAEMRVVGKTADGEEINEREPYYVKADPDQAPVVKITDPQDDISVPANGTLAVTGWAEDDFGVKSMQLRLKVLSAPTKPDLQGKVYRPDARFQLVDGTYPRKLDYTDFLPLATLKTAAGEAFPLVGGMELEFWLEARDNCDYPDRDGNVGESTKRKLTVLPPELNKDKLDKQQQAIAQKTQGAQKQQDQKLAEQNLKKEIEKKADDAGNQDTLQKQQQDFASTADKVQKAIDNQQQKDNSPGQAKGPDNNDGGAKDPGNQGGGQAGNSKDNGPQSKEDAGQDKGSGNQGQGNQAGDGKDQGPPQLNGSGGAKDQGQQQDVKQQAGNVKSDSGPDNRAAESKDAQGQQPQQEATGGGKDKGPDQAKGDQAGTSKSGSNDGAGAPPMAGQKKDGSGPQGGDSASAKGANEQPPKAGPPEGTSHGQANSKDNAATAKQPPNAADKMDLSQAKTGGDQQTGGNKQSVAGEVKGPTTAGQSAPKDAKSTVVGPDVTAKGGEPAPQDVGGDLKGGPPKTAQEAGAGKGPDSKNATLQDVANLKEKLGDPQQGDAAQKGLEQVSDQAADAKVRQAADKALQEQQVKQQNQSAQAKPAQPKQEAVLSQDKAGGQPKDLKEGDAGSAKAGKTDTPPGTKKGSASEGKNTETADGKAKKSSSGSPGAKNQGTVGLDDPKEAMKANADAAARAGELQLENLKKQIDKLRDKLTPKVLQELGWTEKEREDFLRKALEDAILRHKLAEKGVKNQVPLPGSLQALMPGTGPRVISGGKDVHDSANPTQTYEAPPEVREAQRIFLTQPGAKKN